jgi:hypothetical protein
MVVRAGGDLCDGLSSWQPGTPQGRRTRGSGLRLTVLALVQLAAYDVTVSLLVIGRRRADEGRPRLLRSGAVVAMAVGACEATANLGLGFAGDVLPSGAAPHRGLLPGLLEPLAGTTRVWPYRQGGRVAMIAAALAGLPTWDKGPESGGTPRARPCPPTTSCAGTPSCRSSTLRWGPSTPLLRDPHGGEHDSVGTPRHGLADLHLHVDPRRRAAARRPRRPHRGARRARAGQAGRWTPSRGRRGRGRPRGGPRRRHASP